MATITTWGSCPECGDCSEPVCKVEHVIDGWTGKPMHKYTCPDCGETYAIVGYPCAECAKNFSAEQWREMWQRQLNGNGKYAAEVVLKQIAASAGKVA